MTSIYFDADHGDLERRRRLYEGAVYVYSPTDESKKLVEFTKEQCVQAFEPHHPPVAHQDLSVEEYTDILRELKPSFIHHPECKKLLPNLLEKLGCSPTDTYYDVPRLRTACPSQFLSSGLAYAFKPHRDSWYSTPMCQLNWWLPIYPINEDNCMAFHLRYWNQPLRNTSSVFNYQEWNQVGRKQAHSQGKKDQRVQSEALDEVELDPQIRIVCKPGSVIVFSAAHLHSTVPNTTTDTRISIDFRTVNHLDLQAQQGAVNLDGESTGTTTGDYLRIADGAHLPDSIIAEYSSHSPEPRFPNHYDPSSELP